jgi:hypothetical protein
MFDLLVPVWGGPVILEQDGEGGITMKSYEQLPVLLQLMRVDRSQPTGRIDQLIQIYDRIARKSCQENKSISFL